MRINDIILSEKTLDIKSTSRPDNARYIINLLHLIDAGSEVLLTFEKTGTAKSVRSIRFLPKAASDIRNIWDPTAPGAIPATSQQISDLFKLQLPAENGQSYLLSKIEKTADIVQKISDTPGNKSYSKFWNDGDIAEGIMSTAVLTKFENNGNLIDASQIFANVQRMTKTGPGQVIFETTSFGKKVELKANLKQKEIDALLRSANDPDEFGKYTGAEQVYKLYSDCAHYVNQSSSVKSAIEKIKNADTQDVIQVTADGVTKEAQHSTKADIWIAVNNKKEKLLSIKTATVKHIGGHAGYEFHKIDSFFHSVFGFHLPDHVKSEFKMVPKLFPVKSGGPVDEQGNRLFPDWKPGDPPPPGYLFNKEREPIAKEARQYNIQHGIKDAYEYCDAQIAEMLSSTTGTAEFVESVIKGIIHHATLGEDVRVVVISPSAKIAFKELEFGPNFTNAMRNFKLTHKLEQTSTGGKHTKKLKVYGHATKPDGKEVLKGSSELFQLRTYEQDGAMRNVVEIGDLIKSITDVAELEGADVKSTFDLKAKQWSQAELKKAGYGNTPTNNAQTTGMIPANPVAGSAPSTKIASYDTVDPENDQVDLMPAPSIEQNEASRKTTMEFKAILRNAGLLKS